MPRAGPPSFLQPEPLSPQHGLFSTVPPAASPSLHPRTETSYLRLGLEPMRLGLKPRQHPWYLVSGSNEARALDVSLQKEISERRSNRLEVDLIRYRETHTPRTECGPSQRTNVAPTFGWLVFIGWVISYANEWGDYSNHFCEGQRYPGSGPLSTPWSLNCALELSWHLWVCHFTSQLRIKF